MATGQINILTQHNDNQRTGANLNETILNASNVNVNSFGKLFTRAVDGQIYAQPLYVSGLNVGGKTRNVVYVATEHNSVYAFDADDPAASAPLWQVNLGTSAPSPNAYFGNRYAPNVNIQPEFGITSTPVIDATTGTLYVVAFTQDRDGGPYHQTLHARDIRTGQERFGGPVEIEASLPGTGYGSDDVDGIPDRRNGQIIFNPMQGLQRAGLLLSKGILYIAFASHADTDPYHGWVLAYDAALLQQRGAFCVTPNGNEAGIWQSGQGLVGDAEGSVYCMTGNGTYGGSGNFGDSFVKLRLTGSVFGVADSFTPYDQGALESADNDLGSAGPMLLPGTRLLLGGGKEGKLYLLNCDDMGGYNPSDDTQIVQSFPAVHGHIHSSPIGWNGPDGLLVYVWSEWDTLKAWKFDGSRLGTTPFAQSAMEAMGAGGAISLSARGGAAGTGIVWATQAFAGNALLDTVPGIFRAFDASTLREIWNSRQNVARDDTGNFAKFCPPTIANGKVYLATFSGQLAVYGLGDFLATPVIAPGGGAFYPSVTVRISEATPGAAVTYTTDGSDPTPASTPYAGPFVLAGSATVKAKAFKAGRPDSSTSSEDFALVRPGSVTSINFVGGGPNGIPAAMGPAEAAGFLSMAHWNNAANSIGSLSPLQNDLGALSGAFITWTCDNTWSTAIPDVAGNNRMMKGYLDTGHVNPTTVQVGGLPAAITVHGYDVYVYVDGGYTPATRTGVYSIGSTAFSLTDPGGVDFSGTFLRADNSVGNYSVGNYLVFTGVTGSGFTLTATPGPAADGIQRAPLNAIQIVGHPALQTVSGKVVLQGCVNSAQPIAFTLRPAGGGPPFTRTLTLAADGTFRLSAVPAGSYTLAVKGSRWLQKRLPVDVSNGDVSGLILTLPAGDVNGDNRVDILDLGRLADAFNTTPASPKWNADADLNCDGRVDILDLGLLADNFGKTGDP
jgi:hypothetical protein